MNNKLLKALLYPPFAVPIILLPLSTALLVWSMVAVGTESVIAIVSYVLAAYTLTVWCFRIPFLIRLFKKLKNENKYVLIWRSDAHLRVKTTLLLSLAFNLVYGIFHLWLGIYHKTFWFSSLAVYYVTLAVMRFMLMKYSRANKPGEKPMEELRRFLACGWIFLVTNLALSIVIFFMIYWNRTFYHHEITTIALAAYTFTSFTVAIVGLIRYRKYKSPVYNASKAISLASASVSMLTLEATMLTTFGKTESPMFRIIMLSFTGIAVSVFILGMSVYMIRSSIKQLRTLNDADKECSRVE